MSRAGDQTQAWWHARLGSAFRTAVACMVVGCTTLYSPEPVRHLLAYPAFSYVTTILIVSDATLGDTWRGCWHVLYATVQVVLPCMLSLWIIGPARFTEILAAVAVAVGSFVVALPESTHLTAKRIAFGQIVIVYVGAVVHGAETGAFMHPIRVASSTGLGALACLLAMLFPYPRLAYYEMRKTRRLYIENATERLNYFVKAFLAQDKPTSLDLISQAKSLSRAGTKLLQRIKYNQEGVLWEIPRIRFSRPNFMDPQEKLQDMEIPIRGMEIALSSCPSFPVGIVDQELRDVLTRTQEQLGLKLEQAKCSAPFDAMTAPETKGERHVLDNSLNILRTMSTSHKDLPAFFFLNCIDILQDDTPITPNPKNIHKLNNEEAIDSQKQEDCSYFKRIWNSLIIRPNGERLLFALKCSLSLGFAVLFGLMYDKENGYWSGLTIAISFVRGRQATFTMANARAQGTAMGSVYGILCCFIFHRSKDLMFFSLLPWIIFTSFLRHSKMYGQAGAISAVIGALLILGRQHYGTPSEFAIARITEASIGLICFIAVEILLYPTRAATLAKLELSRSLGTLGECIDQIAICASQKNMPASVFLELREKQSKLKFHVTELEKFTAEAEMEPNFWFLPFQGVCYSKLLGSLTLMKNLLLIMAYKTEFLSQVTQRPCVAWEELQEHLKGDLKLFKEKVGCSLKCLQEVTLIRSIPKLKKELQQKNMSHDIESVKPQDTNVFSILGMDDEENESILSSFLQHSKEIADQIKAQENEDDELQRQMILCLSGFGFCISSLMKETKDIEKEVKELIKRENPSSTIDLHEISCMINALNT